LTDCRKLINKLTRDIRIWCIHHNIWLSAGYLSGSENVEADKMSRTINIDTEWMINDNIFNTVVSVFGNPSIDLFASRLIYKIDLTFHGNQIP
jgi:hypothetical protein